MPTPSPDTGNAAVAWYVVGQVFNTGSALPGSTQFLPISGDPQVKSYNATDSATLEAGQPVNGYYKVAGPFATQASAAEYIVSQQVLASAQGIANTHPPFLARVVQDVKSAVGSPLKGIEAVGDFFQRLTQASTWLRIFEVGIGIILVAVGIASLTKAVPIATGIAKVVA
jgi:hypothetical protein